MYSYKRMNGGEYVIHDETGCSLPYHAKTIRYTEMDIPEWKYDYFNRWIVHYSNAMRKNVKKMSYTTSVTSVPSGFNWVTSTIPFALLPTATVSPAHDMLPEPEYYKKEEGNKPMRNYNDTMAVAAISNPKSDESIQREYLIGRLNESSYPKREELTKLFNLYVNNAPKTYKELIAAIKDGKYTLDAKRTARVDAKIADDEDGIFYIDCFDGILWDGPQPDLKGYQAANVEMNKKWTSAKDTIMTGDAAAGLKALQNFAAWLPETGTKAN